MKKGVPHAEKIFPKYLQFADNHKCDYPLLTFNQCKDMNEQYMAAGEKAKSLNFENCEHAPLLPVEPALKKFNST